MSTNRTKIYRFKCQQCGYRLTITKEEWLQAGDIPAQTKTLSPQEKQAKRTVVESLINRIGKM
jgi:peptide subunit release factor 1 (eRF1)